jgi:signal transduction histidine kinase
MKAERDKNLPQNRLLFRRKLTVALVVLMTFVFLLIFNIGSYFFLQQIDVHLETALDDRLKTAAGLAADIIQRDLFDIYDADRHSQIRLMLSQIRLRNDFEAVYLMDTDLNVLVDSQPDFELSVSRGYLRNDSTAIEKAVDGAVTTSVLYTVEGNHFKNGYAAVNDLLYGNTAVLVLEANADFFDIIQFFRRGLLTGAITSFLLLVLLTLFLIWATSLFVKTESRLHESLRLAAMGQMAATVAHEIRNPLGIIKSTSDVLRERYHPPKHPDELFDYIDDEIKRLNRLVDDFLSFARTPELTLNRHNLVKIVGDGVSTFRTECPAKIELIFESPEDEIFCLVDADRIHQVILNLLINASQAIDQHDSGRIDVTCRIEKNRKIPRAVVSVEDTGSGLQGDPDEIFTPFYTTKSKGTGLGLAVSKSIIERHRGQIAVDSRPGRGTKIEFYLPLRDNDVAG